MARAHKTHLASTVPPIMGESPSGPLVETLCNRYCPEPIVALETRTETPILPKPSFS